MYIRFHKGSQQCQSKHKSQRFHYELKFPKLFKDQIVCVTTHARFTALAYSCLQWFYLCLFLGQISKMEMILRTTLHLHEL